MEYKLCYLDDEKGCAYFTNKDLKEQWGDDWDDIPYEHNAGEPYYDNEDDIKKIYFELPIEYKTPRFGQLNSTFSVREINEGAIAWIWNGDFKLFAGTTMNDFIECIQQNHGKIYLEMENNYGN